MPKKEKKEDSTQSLLLKLVVAVVLFILVVVGLIVASYVYYNSYSRRLESLQRDLQCMECCISGNSGKQCAVECEDRIQCDWQNDPNYSEAKISKVVDDVLKEEESILADLRGDKKIDKIKKQLTDEILGQDRPSTHLVITRVPPDKTTRQRKLKRRSLPQTGELQWHWTNGAGEAFNTKLYNKDAFRFNHTNGKLNVEILESGKYNLQMHTTFIADNRKGLKGKINKFHKVEQKIYKSEDTENPILKESKVFSTKLCTLESSAVLALRRNDRLHFTHHYPSRHVAISDKEADTSISLYMI